MPRRRAPRPPTAPTRRRRSPCAYGRGAHRSPPARPSTGSGASRRDRRSTRRTARGPTRATAGATAARSAARSRREVPLAPSHSASGAGGGAGEPRLEPQDRLGVQLRDARLRDAEHLADLAQGQLLVVVERDDELLALGEARDRVGEQLLRLGLVER